MLVQVGDCEVLLDDSTRLAERAKAAGVEVTLEVWDEMIHVWHFFAAMLPEAQQAIDRVGGYVRERISARAGAQAGGFLAAEPDSDSNTARAFSPEPCCHPERQS